MLFRKLVEFLTGQQSERIGLSCLSPSTVSQTASLSEVIEHLNDRGPDCQNAIFVKQSEQVVGLVTECDVVYLMANGVSLDTPIAQCIAAFAEPSSEQSLDLLDILDSVHHLWPW